ncbi:HIT-like protein [Martensiomyces pterosporus]|nr:HIT-like protein [Martensiomyces pterosporus]
MLPGAAAARTLQFGAIKIPLSQSFLVSRLSFGLVNLKPIRPGHVLVVSRRRVARFNELSSDEVADLFLQGQRVSKVIERLYKADSMTLCIQDGKEAGQTVPHVHLHIIPRNKGDFDSNDEIYDELDGRMPPAPQRGQRGMDNDERDPRSAEDMASEAEVLRKEFGTWNEGL